MKEKYIKYMNTKVQVYKVEFTILNEDKKVNWVNMIFNIKIYNSNNMLLKEKSSDFGYHTIYTTKYDAMDDVTDRIINRLEKWDLVE